MLPTLHEQIEDALLLVRGARERGDAAAEIVQTERVDNLLARYPHSSRF